MKRMNRLHLILITFSVIGGHLIAATETPTGPDYFADAYIKSTSLKVTEFQLKQSKKRDMRGAPTGVFYSGIIAAYEATKNQSLLDAVYQMGAANAWKPGPKLMFPDHHIILNPYLELYRLRPEPKLIAPAKEFVDQYLKSPVNDTQNQLITWWLCDYVFMDSPVFIKLGKIMNRPELLTKNDQLWHECYDLLFDTQESLFEVSPKNKIY